MDAKELVKEMSIIVPIVVLVTTGLAIMVRSGITNLKSNQGLRQLACTLSQTLLVLVGCLISILVIERLTGFRVG